MREALTCRIKIVCFMALFFAPIALLQYGVSLDSHSKRANYLPPPPRPFPVILDARAVAEVQP